MCVRLCLLYAAYFLFMFCIIGSYIMEGATILLVMPNIIFGGFIILINLLWVIFIYKQLTGLFSTLLERE